MDALFAPYGAADKAREELCTRLKGELQREVSRRVEVESRCSVLENELEMAKQCWKTILDNDAQEKNWWKLVAGEVKDMPAEAQVECLSEKMHIMEAELAEKSSQVARKDKLILDLQ
eukprot:gene11008-9613_t